MGATTSCMGVCQTSNESRHSGLASSAVPSAATIAIPYSFKRIIDRGFAADGGAAVAGAFHYMLMIVAVLAIGVPVPGAWAGSSTSMSRETYSGRSPIRSRRICTTRSTPSR